MPGFATFKGIDCVCPHPTMSDPHDECSHAVLLDKGPYQQEQTAGMLASSGAARS